MLCSFLSNDIICHVIQEDVWWESSDRGLSGHSVGRHCVHFGAEGEHQVGGESYYNITFYHLDLPSNPVESSPTTLSGWTWETYSGFNPFLEK